MLVPGPPSSLSKSGRLSPAPTSHPEGSVVEPDSSSFSCTPNETHGVPLLESVSEKVE